MEECANSFFVGVNPSRRITSDVGGGTAAGAAAGRLGGAYPELLPPELPPVTLALPELDEEYAVVAELGGGAPTLGVGCGLGVCSRDPRKEVSK